MREGALVLEHDCYLQFKSPILMRQGNPLTLLQQQSYHQMRSLAVALVLMLAVQSIQQQTQCQKFVQKVIDQIITDQTVDKALLPTLAYSGINLNNPGQFKQCNDVHYQYYFLYVPKNESLPCSTYTSLCVPNFCTPDDVQSYIGSYVNATIYDYPETRQLDGLAITGIVILSLWLAVLVGWSCFTFLTREQSKVVPGETKPKRTSINDEAEVVETVGDVKESHNLFIFYEGYKQLFKSPKKKSIFSPIMFLSVLGYLISIEFSYRQSVAENQVTNASNLLHSFGGLIACNSEVYLSVIMFVFGLRFAYGIYKADTLSKIARFYFDEALKKWALLFLMSLFVYSWMESFTDRPLHKLWNINNGQDCPGYMWQIWFLFRNMQVDCKRCLPWLSVFSSEIFFMLVSAPILLVHRTFRKAGYGLFSLVVVLSVICSYAILDSEKIMYEPAKLLNGDIHYAYNYQPNTFVRMGAFFFGLMYGLFIVEGLEKATTDGERQFESEIAKSVRRNTVLQISLQLTGSGLMALLYLIIIPYLSPDASNKQPYGFLIFAPLFFVVGLALFVLPSFWEGECTATKVINSVLGWGKWVHLDRVSMAMLMVGPMVIGFTVYGLQSSIYYDWSTLLTYGLGDLVLAYLFAVAIATAFECQLNSLWAYLQERLYGKENKYSVLVIEEE